MATIKGKDFNFSATINGNREVFCMATDFTLNTIADMIENTGPNNGSWRSFRPGLLSYTISVPGLHSYTESFNIVHLQEIQNSRQPIEWFASSEEEGGLTYHGFAYISSINNTAQMRDMVKFDMTAQGTGIQDILKIPIVKQVQLTNRQSIRLPGCPNPYPVGVLWYDGTFIGPAANADDVISVFNTYASTQGNYLQLVSSSTGCDFTMSVAWNSPLNPDIVYAISAPGFAMRGTFADEAIGGEFNTNEVISA